MSEQVPHARVTSDDRDARTVARPLPARYRDRCRARLEYVPRRARRSVYDDLTRLRGDDDGSVGTRQVYARMQSRRRPRR